MARAVLSRDFSPRELPVLQAQLQNIRAHFKQVPTAADELISVGQLELNSNVDPVETAALMTVASTILNLDEAISRE